MSSKPLSNTINPEAIRDALQYIKRPGSFEEKITERMTELLKSAKATAFDIEMDKAQHYAGLRPQDRRDQFNRMAGDIDGVAEELKVFQAPLFRYAKDRDTPPVRPTGLSALRRSLGDNLNGTLSVDYINTFGIQPFQFDRQNVSLGPINTRNRAEAISASGEEILIDLLKQISGSLRAAERLIAEHTKSGPREWPFRHRVLVNLVVIWQEIHEDSGELSYGGGKSAFFEFCLALCRAMDAGELCTPTHLQTAVEYYNNEIVEKPTPDPTQDSPITGIEKAH